MDCVAAEATDCVAASFAEAATTVKRSTAANTAFIVTSLSCELAESQIS